MKILTVCSAGNVRSVTLRWAFYHLGLGHDVIACGVDANTPETVEMLCDWADKILITDEPFAEKIPDRFEPKAELWMIGPDRWGQAMVPALAQFCLQLVQQGQDHWKEAGEG